MKTYTKHSRILNQNILIVIVVLLTLLGLSVKLQAQTPIQGTDKEDMTSSVNTQMSNHDFDVLIPKVVSNSLLTYDELYLNQ